MKYHNSVCVKSLIAMVLTTIIGCSSDSGSTTTATATENWSGLWSNTTFGSNGDFTMQITHNGNGTVTVMIDLGSGIGGMFDPDPQTITATEAANGDVSFSGMVDMVGMQGQLDFTLTDAGALTISMPNIPVAGFSSFTATGTVTDTNATISNYTINFSPTGSAVGTASATKS